MFESEEVLVPFDAPVYALDFDSDNGRVLVADARARLRLVFLTNGTPKPYRWAIQDRDLRRVGAALKSSAERVLGTLHSHPVGYATPSATDQRSCPLGAYMLIYDVCGQGRLIPGWKA